MGVLGESAGTYAGLAMSVRSKTVEDFEVAGGESDDDVRGGGCENGGCAGRCVRGKICRQSMDGPRVR